MDTNMGDKRPSYPKKGIVWAAVTAETWRTKNNGEIARHYGVTLQVVKQARTRHGGIPSPAARGGPRRKPPIVTMRPVEPLVMTEEVRVYGVLAAYNDLSAEGQAFIRKAIDIQATQGKAER